MEPKWRYSCCGLPLLFAMVYVVTLLLLVAAQPLSDTQPQADRSVSHQSQRALEQASGTAQIQILGTPYDQADIARGQAIYTQYCAACHGIDGQGQFPEAPLEPDSTGRIGAPPHNETGHSWHHSDVLLIRYVTEGGFSDPARFYIMPPFGAILSEAQILQVIAYIKTLWTDEQRASQRQLTEEEQRMFSP